MLTNIFFTPYTANVIVPILVAVFSVYAAEIFSRKRDAAQKKKEFQIKYLRENIKFLYEIKIRSVACGDKIENYLPKVDPIERDNQYNNVKDSIYEVKTMPALEGYDVKCFMKCMGLCTIGTESFEIEKNVENMQKLLEQYYHESRVFGISF